MPLRPLPLLIAPHLIAPVLIVLAAPLLIGAQAPPSLDGTEWAQLTIHERLIIRIPRVGPPGSAPAPDPWVEGEAPRCLPMTALTGATITREGEVDLVVEGTRRIRAKLEDDCPTLDFYSGFYLKPTRDGKICAGRDAIRSRSGARCAIDKFRTLVARR